MSEQTKTPRLTADEIGQIRAYAAGDADHIPYDLQRDRGIWGAVKLLCEMAEQSLELAAVRAELEEARKICVVSPGLCVARVLRSDRDRWKVRAQSAESALAERKADGEDAARYRWLRSHTDEAGNIDETLHVACDDVRFKGKWALLGDDLDSAIDALRGEVKS